MPKNPTYPERLDQVKQITITGLRKGGFLRPDSITSGTYDWTCNGEPSGSIAVTANLIGGFVEFEYSYGGKPIKYDVSLVSLPKHFGGYEWYFVCPVTGKRCRTLYGIGEKFLSRHAYPSAMYSQQTESRSWRSLLSPLRYWITHRENESKRYYRKVYKGKLTKRFLRDLERHARFLNVKLDPRLRS